MCRFWIWLGGVYPPAWPAFKPKVRDLDILNHCVSSSTSKGEKFSVRVCESGCVLQDLSL